MTNTKRLIENGGVEWKDFGHHRIYINISLIKKILRILGHDAVGDYHSFYLDCDDGLYAIDDESHESYGEAVIEWLEAEHEADEAGEQIDPSLPLRTISVSHQTGYYYDQDDGPPWRVGQIVTEEEDSELMVVNRVERDVQIDYDDDDYQIITYTAHLRQPTADEEAGYMAAVAIQAEETTATKRLATIFREILTGEHGEDTTPPDNIEWQEVYSWGERTGRLAYADILYVGSTPNWIQARHVDADNDRADRSVTIEAKDLVDEILGKNEKSGFSPVLQGGD